ncbi:hypothetical protein KBZ20_04525 [Vulcanococcus limneticus Candia 3F8]|nr:hypothetical protein [Vulcanococcus limneticus MW73D5]MCP9893041.1 hypothetical protein [Vulcanococcus limneticus Candia 3F8]MCP9896821.1 hypothetical protein [Vulcanococcus limneticus Candia 3B3]
MSLFLIGALAAPMLPAQALAAGASVLTGSVPRSGALADAAELLARGGGGGGRGGGGSRGGGNFGGGGGRASSGFGGAGGGLNRGASRPSGGWSNSVGGGSASRPSLDRPSGGRDFSRPSGGTRDLARPSGGLGSNGRTPITNRPGAGTRDLGTNRNLGANRDINRDLNRNVNRDLNRDFSRDVNRNVNRTINRDVNRNWNRQVNINNVNVRPGWARPGWGVARPWNYGWYGGWATPAWGWWGARAAAWGVATLATAAIINNAVDDAISNNQTFIVVPSTSYQLLYGSVQPSSSSSVTFVVMADGNSYQLSADCNSGLLDGREPQSLEEAQLLNAACQVAFGAA